MIDLSKMGLADIDISMLPPQLLGRLSFEITKPSKAPLEPGYHGLGIAEERDCMLFVPEGIDTSKPVPLVVMFHGTGGWADKVRPFLQPHAEANKFLLMLPQSQFVTWDLTIGGNGPDLQRLNQSLSIVADHFQIDKDHFAFAGWSDGASYALSNGISNGDILSHVICMSGGYMNVYKPHGEPKVFIQHSPDDEQLPIDTSGRKHAQMLKTAGYDVTYFESRGPHKITEEVVQAAINFFLA